MRTNHIKAALARGETVFGAWLSLPSVFTTRLIARHGFDWLMVDMEHGPIDFTIMAQMVGVIADSGGPAPFVRVPSNSVENIKRVLDSGAWGVLVPMVNSRAEAEAVVMASKYPPQGGRSLGGPFGPLGFGTTRPAYAEKANDEIMVCIQIESAEAVENCEEIISTPGIDVAFIGPNDLSASLGLVPSSENSDPVFIKAVDRIKEAATRHNVPLGMFSTNGEAARIRAQEGFRFISAITDAGALETGLRANLDTARNK
ncbi:MAG TPA: aldolase/citrate lyase family protein [Chloroflexia bacterium]|nr:aldolase/citrate lyase family protein [Chloroflexia bacterium]